MFLGVSNCVERPEGIIPSFVSIETSEEVLDFQGRILAASSEIVPESLLGGTEGKFGCFQRRASSGDSRGVADLVKDGSQIVGGIEQNAGQDLRQLLSDLDFIKILAGIRIFVNEAGPWIVSRKSRM